MFFVIQSSMHRRRSPAKSFGLCLLLAGALGCRADDVQVRESQSAVIKSGYYVTNVAQFRTLSGADYLEGCDFDLTGVVTLVDTNRDLVVLQDATGAVALNFPIGNRKLQVGQLVAVDGTNCFPLFSSFPDYPCRPSGWGVCSSFETPSDWGLYNLTRMRGYVHPEVTGDYTFWIASDNSSELWLSTDANPSRERKIAFVPRFDWVAPRDWSQFPSQRSEPIHLEAGKTYYIEALQEQTTGGENLSVAWQGPGMNRSVIDNQHLTPWNEDRNPGEIATHGILREYWTNFSAGDLMGIGGGRPFESALTFKDVNLRIDGPGLLPNPEPIVLNQPLPPEKDYRWAQVEGIVLFKATDENTASLELSDGQALVQVRVEHWSQEMSKQLRQSSNIVVRVNGVCEGVDNAQGTIMPRLIWASATNSISFVTPSTTNSLTSAAPSSRLVFTNSATSPASQAFYGIRGVVTFNGQVFGTGYILVQADSTTVRVALDEDDRYLESHLKLGEWVDVGGTLETGKSLPVVSPLVISELGWYTMPAPIVNPLSVSTMASQEGRWSELECVVHSVNTNGTLSVAGKDGMAYLWLGQASRDNLARYVDAKIRARGVMMVDLLDEPVVLVPSLNFLDVEEEAPQAPFDAPRHLIADILSANADSLFSRRMRVTGEVTYRGDHSFFIQDVSGGIRVQTPGSANSDTWRNGRGRCLSHVERPRSYLDRTGRATGRISRCESVPGIWN